MSVLGHVAMGVAAARLVTAPGEPRHLLPSRMVMLAALALLPDVDLIFPGLGQSMGPLDHRGATHSFAFALVIGASVAIGTRVRRSARPVTMGLVATAAVASHGVLDSLGASDQGVALLWPMTDARFLAAWHFLPNPTLPGLFSATGLSLLAFEFAVFLPFWFYAFVPRRPPVARAQR